MAFDPVQSVLPLAVEQVCLPNDFLHLILLVFLCSRFFIGPLLNLVLDPIKVLTNLFIYVELRALKFFVSCCACVCISEVHARDGCGLEEVRWLSIMGHTGAEVVTTIGNSHLVPACNG